MRWRGSTLARDPLWLWNPGQTSPELLRSPKQGYQWPHKKDSCSLKNFKKSLCDWGKYLSHNSRVELELYDILVDFKWWHWSVVFTFGTYKPLNISPTLTCYMNNVEIGNQAWQITCIPFSSRTAYWREKTAQFLQNDFFFLLTDLLFMICSRQTIQEASTLLKSIHMLLCQCVRSSQWTGSNEIILVLLVSSLLK